MFQKTSVFFVKNPIFANLCISFFFVKNPNFANLCVQKVVLVNSLGSALKKTTKTKFKM